MRVAFDATSLIRLPTGIETYTRNLLDALLRTGGGCEYIVFFRGRVPEVMDVFSDRTRILMCGSKNQLVCDQAWLPRVLAREKPDVVHFPAFPPGLLAGGRQVVTVFDAALWRRTKDFSWKGRFYMKTMIARAARRAEVVLTISEHARREIIECLGLPDDKVVAAGIAPGPEFQQLVPGEWQEATRRAFGLPERFILSVGSLEPRKNLGFLLDVYRDLKASGRVAHGLVLVGRAAWGAKSIRDSVRALGLERDVVLTGHIPGRDLVRIYNLAEIFVFPSLYEGFGLPVLEAMACGLPVACTNASSLPEAAGGAALLFDPRYAGDAAAAVARIAADSGLRGELSRKGLRRAAEFSWDRVAAEVLAVYRRVGERKYFKGVRKKIDLFGVSIDNLDMAGALAEIERLMARGGPALVVTPNVQHINLIRKDADFRAAYTSASLVLPDSVPLIWLSRLLGRRLKVRVAGSDILPAFCPLAAAKGYRPFLLGSMPGVAARAAEILEKANPGLMIAGVYCPPLGFEQSAEECRKTIAAVRSARPDALFVGLGSPKGEIWALRNLEAMGVPVTICVGAAFDFITGRLRRAPRWLQRIGLEWFFRLMQEPRRMWRRYILGNAEFLVFLVRWMIEGRPRK